MSVFKFLFGKKENDKIPTPQEAIQKILEIEELLNKKSELLENKIEEQIEIAKKNASKNKKIAIKALKTKKRFEKQLQELDGTLTSLEYQRESLENASSNAEILKTMHFAATAFKNAHGGFDIDQVNDLKDQIAEQQELASEITQAISRPGFSEDIDEDDLIKELEELENEDLDEKLFNIPNALIDDLPSSKEKTKVKENNKEDDLKKLEDWAS